MVIIMGYGEILCIYEDGIREALESEIIPEDYFKEVGKAVFEVISKERNPFIKSKSAGVFNHGNCVYFVDEVHSTKQRLYLWVNNCLQPIRELNEKDFTIVENIIEAERKRRTR